MRRCNLQERWWQLLQICKRRRCNLHQWAAEEVEELLQELFAEEESEGESDGVREEERGGMVSTRCCSIGTVFPWAVPACAMPSSTMRREAWTEAEEELVHDAGEAPAHDAGEAPAHGEAEPEAMTRLAVAAVQAEVNALAAVTAALDALADRSSKASSGA